MKLLLDTNLILDIALERQPFYSDSLKVLTLIYQQQAEGYLSASSITDLYYILCKVKTRDETLDFIRRILTFCQIATVDGAAIETALDSDFKDFEDAIQHSTALINQLDIIITRNPKDYSTALLPVLTPTQLIQQLNP